MTSPRSRLDRRGLIKATSIGGLALVAGALANVALPANAATFGFSDDGSSFVVDTGAYLVLRPAPSTPATSVPPGRSRSASRGYVPASGRGRVRRCRYQRP